MRIVQSTWFPDPTNIAGRWIDTKFSLFNLALSCYTLSKFYPEIVLYTDEIGYTVLIEQLNLPYSDVVVNLENPIEKVDNICLDTYWVLRKLYTYSVQESPFIHIDNDVYLFKEFDKKLIGAPICAQNIETNTYYAETLKTVQDKFVYVPDWLKNTSIEECNAVNAGIMGGRDYTFFRNLYAELIKFIQKNKSCIHLVSTDDINIFLEQCMLKCYADYLNLTCEYQLDFIYTADMSYNAYKLHDTPTLSTYIHVMNCKSNDTVCEAVAKTLYLENYNLYNKCIDISKLYTPQKKHFLQYDEKNDELESQNLIRFFYRTQLIVSHISNNIQLDFLTIDSLINSIDSIQNCIDNNLYNLLLDIFYFECMRYEFIVSLDKMYVKILYTNLVDSREKLDRSRFAEYKLTLSKNIKLISSRWLWVQRNEFISARDKSFEENILQSPGYFESVIYYYPELQKIKEQQLDQTNKQIIDYAMLGLSIAEIISRLKKAILYKENVQDAETIFESRIRYLIYQGVFYLEPVDKELKNESQLLKGETAEMEF